MLADIGIPDALVAEADEGLRANEPAPVAASAAACATEDSHKYRFGHALVVGGPKETTGAARLAAGAALAGGGRPGQHRLPARRAADLRRPSDRGDDQAGGGRRGPGARCSPTRRLSALLIGPGAGVGDATREQVAAVLAAGRPTVLDADALTSFAEHRDGAAAASCGPTACSPRTTASSRACSTSAATGSARARAGERGVRCGGPAEGCRHGGGGTGRPGRRAAWAPPALATAGTGDVLAGLIVGLLAQGVPAFEAAAAGVWLHAAAAVAGPG